MSKLSLNGFCTGCESPPSPPSFHRTFHKENANNTSRTAFTKTTTTTYVLTNKDKTRVYFSGEAQETFHVALTIEVNIRKSKDTKAIPVQHSDVGGLTLKIDEEDIREKYPWSYEILTTRLQNRYSDFRANQKYHLIRKPLEPDARYCRERLLDPGKPAGIKKKFYNPNIVRIFDEHYTRTKDGHSAIQTENVP